MFKNGLKKFNNKSKQKLNKKILNLLKSKNSMQFNKNILIQLKKLDKAICLYLKSLTCRKKSRARYKNTQNRGYKHVIKRLS